MWRLGQFGVEPGTGHLPIPMGRALGNLESGGDVVEAQAGKKMQLHNLISAFGGQTETFQCQIEGQNGFHLSWVGAEMEGGFHVDAGETALALGGAMGAGVRDEHPAHGAGGEEVEVAAVGPIDGAGAGQAEEGFVEQGRGLQGVAGTLGMELVGGNAAELSKDERVQRLFRLPVPRGKALQEDRNLIGLFARRHWCWNFISIREKR